MTNQLVELNSRAFHNKYNHMSDFESSKGYNIFKMQFEKNYLRELDPVKLHYYSQ